METRMKEFLEVRYCTACCWMVGTGMCRHPKLQDVATGEMTECKDNRSFKAQGEQLTLPHCGPEGLFWEERQPAALQAPGAGANHAT
jgi:hypothetical protein